MTEKYDIIPEKQKTKTKQTNKEKRNHTGNFKWSQLYLNKIGPWGGLAPVRCITVNA